MRRSRVSVALALLLALTACGLPRERDNDQVRKSAVTVAEAQAVFQNYLEVRNSAAGLLDPRPLSIVESGAVLAIDTGSFEVSQKLAATQQQVGAISVDQVYSPTFTRYPLWFVAVVADEGADVKRVQVFQRSRAIDPWLLVATPETVAGAQLPELRSTKDSDLLPVAPDNARGMALSPQAAADAYAAALQNGTSDAVPGDDFTAQMSTLAQQNGSLPGVGFGQTWTAEPVEFAARTADGGALVFVTLNRQDAYQVPPGRTVTWPEGSAQAAFLTDGISGTATLKFQHQVLLYLPGGSTGPRAIGQFGGFVGLAEGGL